MSKSGTVTIDIAARDLRFLRAGKEVLKNYKRIRRPQLENGRVVFDITGGQAPYVVRVHPEWKGDPVCTCPDAADRARTCTSGYCKHIIAVLIENADLRGQLLEVFL